MFDKQYVMMSLTNDLIAANNRRYMSEYCTDEKQKQMLWNEYLTALQIRYGKVEMLNAFGYKPVYSSDMRKCIDIVPLDRG